MVYYILFNKAGRRKGSEGSIKQYIGGKKTIGGAIDLGCK